MKRFLLLLIVITLLLTACQNAQEPLAKIDKEKIVKDVTTLPQTPTATINNIPTSTIVPSSTPQPSATDDITEDKDEEAKPTENIIVISTIKPTEKVSSTPTEKPTTKPSNTPTLQPTATVQIIITTAKPIETPDITTSPTIKPTPEPTKPSSYTVINNSIRSGALEGINAAREEEGTPHASLDSGLNTQAEAHAIAMAKADSLFHSSMGYVESVRSGANIGGWAEGYGAANHATQLCLDADIIKIGIGSAKSVAGTVYTCVIGDR